MRLKLGSVYGNSRDLSRSDFRHASQPIGINIRLSRCSAIKNFFASMRGKLHRLREGGQITEAFPRDEALRYLIRD
jgi:hypothetical protein